MPTRPLSLPLLTARPQVRPQRPLDRRCNHHIRDSSGGEEGAGSIQRQALQRCVLIFLLDGRFADPQIQSSPLVMLGSRLTPTASRAPTSASCGMPSPPAAWVSMPRTTEMTLPSPQAAERNRSPSMTRSIQIVSAVILGYMDNLWACKLPLYNTILHSVLQAVIAIRC